MSQSAPQRETCAPCRPASRDNLARIVDPAALVPALQRAWRGLADEGIEIAACSVERVYARADGGFVLSLDAQFTANGAVYQQPLIAEIPAVDAKSRFEELLRRFRKEKRRHHLKDPTHPSEFCLVPDLNLIVRYAGLDEKIDGLDLLHAPDRLGVILGDAKFAHGQTAGARLMAHRLHRRAVIEISPPQSPPVFLKFYKRGSSRPAHNAALVRLLERTAFPKAGNIRVPGILHLFPEYTGFAMAAASGKPLNYLQGAGRLTGMAFAGEALGLLHRSPLRLDVKFLAQDEVNMLSRLVELAGDIFPGIRKGLKEGLDRVSARLAACRMQELRTLHRDFHERQVIVDGEICHVIDFDTACNGDPHLDIGNFLAHLDFARLQDAGGDSGSAQAFLDAYSRTHCQPDRNGVAAYRQSTLLRLACIYAFSTRWSHVSPRLIELAHGIPP